MRCKGKGLFAALAAAAALAAVTGCSDSPKVEDRRPLPTSAASGDLACGFVSKESLAIALGTKEFDATGEKRDAGGSRGKNPDGSTLSAATCDLYTVAEDKRRVALTVSVQPLGLIPRDDAVVPETLASGRAEYVFPASEGMGFAGSDNALHSGAGVCDLIVGDWHYGVTIQNSVEGRNAVDDAVALTRQVVATLNLPKVGTKPRPTASPTK